MTTKNDQILQGYVYNKENRILVAIIIANTLIECQKIHEEHGYSKQDHYAITFDMKEDNVIPNPQALRIYQSSQPKQNKKSKSNYGQASFPTR